MKLTARPLRLRGGRSACWMRGRAAAYRQSVIQPEELVRAEYDFSKGKRGPYAKVLRELRAEHRRLDKDLPPLTVAETRRLGRQVRDLRDKTRYFIQSRLLRGSRFVLYYNLTDDMWATDLDGATFFKRRRTAEAVRALLGDGARVIRIAKPPQPRGSRARRRAV